MMIKNILILLLVAMLSQSVFAQRQKPGIIHDTVIIRVVDGDNVVIAAPYLPSPLKKELSLRVFGVDTPEKGARAKCKQEAELGAMATDFTKKMVARSKKQQVLLMEWDKYGGRVLGDIVLDGKSLRDMLIQNNLAREYYGDAKSKWCP